MLAIATTLKRNKWSHAKFQLVKVLVESTIQIEYNAGLRANAFTDLLLLIMSPTNSPG